MSRRQMFHFAARIVWVALNPRRCPPLGRLSTLRTAYHVLRAALFGWQVDHH